MGREFVAALDAEITELREDLERDVRFMRLRELERIRRDLYGDSVALNANPVHTTAAVVGTAAISKPPLRKPSPQRSRAIELAQSYVGGQGVPVPTADVLEHLLQNGVSIAGEKPANNLSALMSNSGLFQSNGRAGWTLKAAHGSQEDQEDAVAEEGLDEPGQKANAGEPPTAATDPDPKSNPLWGQY